MLTEAFDPRAAAWLVYDATAADVASYWKSDSNFAKLQGLTVEDANAPALLMILKEQIAAWVKSGGKVYYRYGLHFHDSQAGRLIASTGYQNWPRFVRATLAKDLYWDVDMVNAQPTLLLHLARQHNWPHSHLEHYVTERDTILHLVTTNLPQCSTADAKQKVLAIVCGCSEDKATEGPAYLHYLWTEVKAMQEAVWALPEFESFKVGVQASQARKQQALGPRATAGYNNEKGALLAIVLQTMERQVLLCIEEHCKTKWHRHMDTLIHDGGLIRRTALDTKEGLATMLESARAAVMDKLGIDIQLQIKPWEEGLVVPAAAPARPLRGWVAQEERRKKSRKRKHHAEAEEDRDAGDDDDDANRLAPGVTRDAYAAMKEEFEQTHFYYVPGNTFVEVTAQGLRHYDVRHAKEYFDIKWAFGGKVNFRYRVSFLDLWRLDPDRRTIQKIEFTPSDDPSVYYWPIEFEYQRHAQLEVGDEDRTRVLDLFMTLIKAASNDQEELSEYLLNYFAHILQKPLEQPGVAIILTGAKGVGKDTLLDFFRLHVVGAGLSHNYTETRQFFDKHDVDRKDKFFLKVEDSDSALCKQHAKDLRARITARESTINPKGKDPITYNNYARYFFSANQAIPVGINDDNDRERRFVILAVSSVLKGNSDFFGRCYNSETGLFSPLGGRVIADMLLSRDLTSFNVRVQPKNEYQENLYEVERSPEQRFLEDGWPAGAEVTSSEAFKRYQSFCSDQGFPKWTETAIGFGQKLAYFVMQRKLIKRVGRRKQVFYKKPVDAKAEDDDEEEDDNEHGGDDAMGAGAPAAAVGWDGPVTHDDPSAPAWGAPAPAFTAMTMYK